CRLFPKSPTLLQVKMIRLRLAALVAAMGCSCSSSVVAQEGDDMCVLQKLFAKGERSSEKKAERSGNFAFVLLSEPSLPETQAVIEAFREFAAPGESLQVGADDSENGSSDEAFSLTLNTGEKSIVVLMPIAVPNGEADQGARFSLSSFRNNWKLPPHHAHLAVMLRAAPDAKPTAALSRFTSLLAAVTKASDAVGVYWGNAGATHDSEFFTSVASKQGVVPRIMLWSGVSVAREKDGRLSLLSLGMEQLKLPNLLLVAGESSAGVAVPTMYDLLAYVAERGKPLPDGDTVGRTGEERLPVRYTKSPVDAEKRVWRVELP
ncbi:MAG: DUF4261 domain-containing protein, partial [Planctomycetota bacterium]